MNINKNHTLILTDRDMESIVRSVGIDTLIDDLIQELQKAIEGYDPEKISIPTRDGFHYFIPHMGLIEWMPMHLHGELAMVKVVGYHPHNPNSTGLPTVISTFSTYDTNTGQLTGLIDGVLPTALRTAAASALASQAMAKADSHTLGIIGCGAQGVAHLHALSRGFELSKVLYYDIDAATEDSFSTRCEVLGVDSDLQPASLKQIVGQADILCTATTIEKDRGPLFDNLPYKNHLHINAIGSDFPGKTEIPLSILQRAFVSPDFREQAKKEGECQQLTDQEIDTDWVKILKNPDQYRGLPDQLTVFDSTGWPLEDHVVMKIFLKYAKHLNIGQSLKIEHTPEDAKNPYHFLSVKESIFG